MDRDDERCHNLAIRISNREKTRLRALANEIGNGDAAVVRIAVNQLCESLGVPAVFREDGR